MARRAHARAVPGPPPEGHRACLHRRPLGRTPARHLPLRRLRRRAVPLRDQVRLGGRAGRASSPRRTGWVAPKRIGLVHGPDRGETARAAAATSATSSTTARTRPGCATASTRRRWSSIRRPDPGSETKPREISRLRASLGSGQTSCRSEVPPTWRDVELCGVRSNASRRWRRPPWIQTPRPGAAWMPKRLRGGAAATAGEDPIAGHRGRRRRRLCSRSPRSSWRRVRAAGRSSSPVASRCRADGGDALQPAGGVELVVEIVGAVLPGRLPAAAGTRIGDLVDAAGGYSPRVDADRASRDLNLAALLADGDQVRVPSRDDDLRRRAVPPAPVGGVPPAGSGGLVDLNAATSAELEALPGIGPVTAGQDHRRRARNSRSRPSTTCARASSLGEKTFEKVRDLVAVH